MNKTYFALGDLTSKIGSGATPRGGQKAYQKEGIPLIRSMNVHDGLFVEDGLAYLNDQQAKGLANVELEPGDVLLNITGASVARSCRVPDKFKGGRVNQHVAIIRPDKRRLSPDYLEHLLINPRVKASLLRIAGGGATREAITKKAIEEFQIPVPPLDQQKRIAAILDQADALRRLRQRASDRLNTLGQAMFQEMFVVTDIPTASLMEVCETITDGTHQTPTYADSGVTFLSAKNVTKRKIDWENTKYISEELHNEISKRITPRRNDILLAKNGTTGVAAKVDTDYVFSIYVSLALLRPLPVVRPDYLLFAVNHENTKRQFDGSLKGVGVSNLHLKDIRSALIPLPSLELQDAFVERIKALSRVENSFHEAAESSNKLFHSLQQRAFQGDL